MNNKKTVKEYIKLYKKLIKNKASGAIGYSEWKGDGFSDLEIAARYLATKGFPVSVDTNLVDNGTFSNSAIIRCASFGSTSESCLRLQL